MRVLWTVIVKELLQLRRDRRMLPMILVAPILELLIFGYAATTEVNLIPMVLVDRDRTAESRQLADRFSASGYFDIRASLDGVTDVDPWLVDGRAQMALIIDHDYGRDVALGRAPRVQVIVDGSDANSAGVGLSYVRGVMARAGAALVPGQLERRGSEGRLIAAAGSIDLVPRVWFNPSLKSQWFYVPAVLAMVLMLITMLLSSMGVVREKEIGTMEQIIVTPIRSWQLIVGKLAPFLVIGLLDLLLVTGVAVAWFHLPLRGSLPLLVGLSLLFMMCTLGLGLLTSTLVANQQQAMISTMFLLMVPMLYLSGLIFPIENMPRPVQFITYAIPLRYYTVIIRGIFLKGSGMAVLWQEALILLVMGLTTLTLASLRFRKRLD